VTKGVSVEKSIIKTPGTLYSIHQPYSFQVILKDKKGNKASREILDKYLKNFAIGVTGSTNEKVLPFINMMFISLLNSSCFLLLLIDHH